MKLDIFKNHIKDFLSYLDVERNLSDHTIRAYAADLQLFCQFWEKISVQDKIEHTLQHTVERYLIALYNKKIQKSSIARKISCFQSYLKFLKSTGHEGLLIIARPRVDKKLPLYLTVDEIFHLLDSIKNNELPTKRPLRDKAILELLYATGIRCSELVNIKLKDINIDEKIIRIYGKGRKERMALFNGKAKERILAYITYERPPALEPDEYLFLNYRNGALTSRSVQRIMEMFRQFLNIKRPITPHNIRHSFATHLLNQGTDLRVVQELLGHRSISSTQRYTHVTTTQLMEMCDTLHPIHSMKVGKEDTE